MAAEGVCAPSDRIASIDELVARVEAEGLRYLFVGERHAVGPVKRFAVDSVNALVERGHDVGLYVEGFRTDCEPTLPGCRSLARLFNEAAFLTLLRESHAAVHPIDPPEDDARVARMAAAIAAGPEPIRVVLVGRSHVLHAGDPGAEHRIYGGAVRYPDPGDLVEAFPRDQSLTVVLEVAEAGQPSYSLRADGCRADYALIARPTSAY